MPLEYMPFLSAGFGALAGAAISHFRDGRKSKSDTTFKLHEEFGGEYMLRCRSIADKLMEEHRGLDLRELYQLRDPKEIDAVWAMLAFYEKLSVAISCGRIDNSLGAHLFGQVFLYWYYRFLKDALSKTSWEAKDRLRLIDEWLQSNASQADYARWTDNVRNWPNN